MIFNDSEDNRISKQSHFSVADQALESSGIPKQVSFIQALIGGSQAGWVDDVAVVCVLFQEISAEKDYSIPRPTTTNINQPYDEYYEHTV